MNALASVTDIYCKETSQVDTESIIMSIDKNTMKHETAYCNKKTLYYRIYLRTLCCALEYIIKHSFSNTISYLEDC